MTNIIAISNHKGGVAKITTCLSLGACLAYRVLVTMYDRRNKICHVILEQMQASLSAALFKTIIEVDTKLRESPVFGQPVTLYTPNTRGAQQYRELAQELMNDGRESQKPT